MIVCVIHFGKNRTHYGPLLDQHDESGKTIKDTLNEVCGGQGGVGISEVRHQPLMPHAAFSPLR